MPTFQDFGLSPSLLQAIEALGFKEPSPIQAQAIPLLLKGTQDFIGLAATGTGKTAAFGLPLLERVDGQTRQTQALILCPTRELAMQVSDQINLLGKFNKIRALPIYGGAGYGPQIQGLKDGATVVVGTPGRVIDHLKRGTLKLDAVKTLVLDEADEMISMGFKEELEMVLKAVSREQTRIWLFSATMSREVRRVADTYLEDPVQVQVNRTEMLPSTVQQLFYQVREGDKMDALSKLIEMAEDFYGLIFCQTKALVADLTRILSDRGLAVDCLHGDMDQRAREMTMQDFRDQRVKILVCTDVASRGLDVKDITHVVNYSLPRELDSYVHRIGRTGRSGKNGIAMSLVSPAHRYLVSRIENMTKSRMTLGEIPQPSELAKKRWSLALKKFQDQPKTEASIENLNDDWKAAIAEMPREEIATRFLLMTSPELFKKIHATPSNFQRLQDSRPQGSFSSSPKAATWAVAEGDGSSPRPHTAKKKFYQSGPKPAHGAPQGNAQFYQNRKNRAAKKFAGGAK